MAPALRGLDRVWAITSRPCRMPLTYLCGLWQLVTAASYIEGDVSPGLWRLDAAASYIEADVSVLHGIANGGACQVQSAKLYDLYDLYDERLKFQVQHLNILKENLFSS